MEHRLILAFLLSAGLVAAGARLYPDPKLTSGKIDPAATKEKVCTPGYTAEDRHVTAATKKQVYQRYAVNPEPGKCCEVDHFVSLELGGANDLSNLWPQPWTPPGAREKDVVETWLHRQVCAGNMTLAHAQEIIRADWYRVYRQIRGAK